MTKTEFVKFNDADFSIVKDIRRTVFQLEQGVPECEDLDRFDEAASTDYVIVYVEDKPVGTGRIIKLKASVKLGRIAVLKEFRGLGLGSVIVNALVKRAFQNGEAAVNINSQNHAIGFYQRLGFEICGEELIEIGIPHTPMRVTAETFKGDKEDE